MKEIKRFASIFLILCAFAFLVCVIILFAIPEDVPSLETITSITERFYIDNNGTATVNADYIANGNGLQDVRIETKIQKRFLLVFWNDVDGGQWTDSFETTTGSFSHTLQLSKTGTYRAVFKIYAVGANGSVDDFELTKEYVYE